MCICEFFLGGRIIGFHQILNWAYISPSRHTRCFNMNVLLPSHTRHMKRTILKIVVTLVHGHGLPEVIIPYGIQRNKYSNFLLHLLILSLGTPLSS